MGIYRVQSHRKDVLHPWTDEMEITARSKKEAIYKARKTYRKHGYGPIIIDDVRDYTEAYRLMQR